MDADVCIVQLAMHFVIDVTYVYVCVCGVFHCVCVVYVSVRVCNVYARARVCTWLTRTVHI